MLFIDNILNFLTDKDKRLSSRATIFLFSVVLILTLDNITGFSNYYNKERQLDQLKAISELLENPRISEETKEKLKTIEKRVFDRKNIFEHSFLYIKNALSNENKTAEALINRESLKRRNDTWFFISSSGIYILVTIIVIPVFLFLDRETPFLKLFASLIMFSIVMVFTSFFNFWLLDKIIPDEVFGSWTWNYIINFLIQVGLLIGLSLANKTIEKVQ